MSPNRLRLVLSAIFIMLMVAVLLWDRGRVDQAEIQQKIDQADRDVAAAKAAADSAGKSAGEAVNAARAAQNALPGSS